MLPKLKADPTFIRRALTNLVNNAIQAMPDGGKLEIAGYTQDGFVCLTVADTGVGISEEVKSKLFTPMFTTKAKGQGLGLAVVKRLVEAQGGSIYFESEMGKGTKFIIKLPLNRTDHPLDLCTKRMHLLEGFEVCSTLVTTIRRNIEHYGFKLFLRAAQPFTAFWTIRHVYLSLGSGKQKVKYKIMWHPKAAAWPNRLL